MPAMPKMFKIDIARVMDSTGALALDDMPAIAAGDRRRLHRPGNGHRLCRARLGGDGRRTARRPAARRRPRPGEAAGKAAPRTLRRHSSQHEGRRAEGRRRQGRRRASKAPSSTARTVRPRAGLRSAAGPVTSGFGLENTKVKVNDTGFVVVDEQQRTADPHILAIGDVAGEPMLAHKASHEGKVAAEVLAGEAAAFEPQAHSRRRVHRSRNRLGRPHRRRGQTRQAATSTVAQYPWQASGRAIANRPHRRAHQVARRPDDRARARLRHRRRRRRRADRRSRRGHRNGLHGARHRPNRSTRIPRSAKHSPSPPKSTSAPRPKCTDQNENRTKSIHHRGHREHRAAMNNEQNHMIMHDGIMYRFVISADHWSFCPTPCPLCPLW